MNARFRGTLWRAGNAHVLTVPAQYVKDGVIKPEIEYQVEISEAGDS